MGNNIYFERFVEQGTKPFEKVFLTDEEYAKARQKFVTLCTDAVIIDRNEKAFYLSKRIIKPQADFWWIGGGVLPGVDPLDSMVKMFESDTSLTLNSERFDLVSGFLTEFKDRQQEPQNVGCATFNLTYTVELTPEERDIVQNNLDPKEYDTSIGLRRFTKTEIENTDLHPAIATLYKLIFENK